MMKSIIVIFLMILFTCGSSIHVSAQSYEIQQLLLDVSKLAELKKILTDLKKGYEIVSKGYNTIKDLSQGNFNLHKTFLDGLLKVSPVVRKYKRVGDIVNYQLVLVKEYKSTLKKVKQDNNFNAEEISYLGKVYDNLFEGSLKNLDELTTILTANKLRMSDEERLEAIDRLFYDMQDKLSFLRYFNNNTAIFALQRAKESKDIQTMQSIHGIH